MNKLFCSVLLCFLLSTNNANATSISGFTGPYAVANWTQTIDSLEGGEGSIDTSGAPNFISFNNVADDHAFVTQIFTIAAPAAGMVSFSWEYFNGNIIHIPGNDFDVLLNGVFTPLICPFLSPECGDIDSGHQSGVFSMLVAKGDVFGFLVNADGTDVADPTASTTVIIHDFSAPSPAVPIPAAAWLFGSALLGLGGISRQRASLAA